MIKTNPDVVRKHSTTPHTWKEAHGCFCDFEDDDARCYPPKWLWVLLCTIAAIVLVLNSVIPL